MASVLANASYYVRITKTCGVAKTKDINEAQIYYYFVEKTEEVLYTYCEEN